jgi:hypothetical protein
MLNVILLSAGIGLGSAGVFICTQTVFATGTILVVTPMIQKLVYDMLVEKWSEVIIIFLGITGFISLSIWTLGSIAEITNVIDKFPWCIIVIGAGIIQLAWIFLVAGEVTDIVGHESDSEERNYVASHREFIS